ncbi:MAG TPA: WcaI family glycosyltransferase [Opitutus sp.]|nr:WcaI family glycosyltransferase [Opitutus sp.]
MKIVLWGINYHPEATGIAPYNTELAEYLSRADHDVTVVTGFPYYPHWRKEPGDRGRLYRTETINGVRVVRCAQYVPGRATTLRRIFHELSFGLSSLLRVLFLSRADVYFVVSPPLVLGFFAWIATRLKRSRYVFHVQDLQPGAAVGLGMVKSRGFIRVLFALERFAYDHAAAVSGISDGMMSEFQRKGVPDRRRIYFPNWLRNSGGAAMPVAAGEFRRKFGVREDDLLAVYSGNLGKKQGIDILLEAARQLMLGDRFARRVALVIAGAGAEREALAERARKLALPNLHLLPLLSDADYASMLADTDVGLITQASGTGEFFFPSKLLSLLQAKVPVVTVADDASELARAVADGGFGANVAPGDAVALAGALASLNRDRSVLAAWRERTRWVNQFSPAAVLPQFARQLELVAGEASGVSEIVGQHEPSRL